MRSAQRSAEFAFLIQDENLQLQKRSLWEFLAATKTLDPYKVFEVLDVALGMHLGHAFPKKEVIAQLMEQPDQIAVDVEWKYSLANAHLQMFVLRPTAGGVKVSLLPMTGSYDIEYQRPKPLSFPLKVTIDVRSDVASDRDHAPECQLLDQGKHMSACLVGQMLKQKNNFDFDRTAHTVAEHQHSVVRERMKIDEDSWRSRLRQAIRSDRCACGISCCCINTTKHEVRVYVTEGEFENFQTWFRSMLEVI